MEFMGLNLYFYSLMVQNQVRTVSDYLRYIVSQMIDNSLPDESLSQNCVRDFL